MTTNHRPTLESKRGRANGIRDTIQHSRSLKGQSSLKLRLDIKGAQIDSSVGKRALDDLESETKRPKTEGGDNENLDVMDNSDESTKNTEKGNITEYDQTEKSTEHDKTAKEDTTSESESEYESEEDEDALMAELAKIKKEREDQKKQVALAGNPLLNKKAKKSWRTSTPFAKKALTKKDFTTSTLDSDTHRQFMSKYFR